MQVTITVNDPTDLEVYKHKPTTWDKVKKELTFSVNVSLVKCWRLIHKNGKVIDMFESGGQTMTIWDLFRGTEAECIEEIERLFLEVDEPENKNVKMAR